MLLGIIDYFLRLISPSLFIVIMHFISAGLDPNNDHLLMSYLFFFTLFIQTSTTQVFDIRWTFSLALKNICLGPLDASVFFHDVQEHCIHGLSVLMCPHRCVPTNQFCFASHKNNDQERKYLSLLVMKPFQLVVDSRLQHCW
jgi:hypothetical protein